MNPIIVTLPHPKRKLVDEVADWLEFRARNDEVGAKSLAHICVVVPTAQSGRSLRLALAKRFPNGLVPPMVVQPMRLVAPADESMPEATDVEVAALFMQFAESRPRRHVNDGGSVELEEWTHLFRPESFGDHDALFSFLDQLSDIWRILGAGGLLMRDVQGCEAAAKVLEEAYGDEAARWQELAELETAFFKFLNEHGLRHRAESLHLAKMTPKALPEEIEEIVLPALADPVPVLYDVLEAQRESLRVTVLLHCDKADEDRFDKWGCPIVGCWTGDAHPVIAGLTDCDIVCAASDSSLAEKIAKDFPSFDEDKAVPSLGLCDEELFPAISVALGENGWEIHNPTKYRLRASSLGRIATSLASLHASADAPYQWDEFTALMREDDVLRHLAWCSDADLALKRRADILHGLDICRNELFPSEIPHDGNLTTDGLDALDERAAQDLDYARRFVDAAVRLAGLLDRARSTSSGVAQFIRKALAEIYKGREMGDSIGDREFAAAIDALLDVLEQFESKVIVSLALSPSMQTALFRKCLSDAAYSLEPNTPKAMMTEGWMELAWSGSDKIALAGFREGAVPDTVSGHVFLPNSLRAALGLPSNDQRLARDAFLLKEMVESRDAGNVRVYFSRTNANGDIHRPSRLLFLVGDGALPRRVEALFGELPADKPRGRRTVAPGWRPRLEKVMLSTGEKEGRAIHLSASRIDTWLKCPFAYYLKYVLRMERVEEKDELGANDFGTLVHGILEEYARRQISLAEKGLPQLREEDGIAKAFHEIAAEFRAGFGATPSLKIRLQLDAAEKRLENVAKVQAAWADKGWQIVAAELPFEVRPFEGDSDADVVFSGSIDRIDWHKDFGYRLIDYKTWDDKSRASGYALKGGEEEVNHAELLGLPLTKEYSKAAKKGEEPKPKFRRFLSIQLLLYGLCFEKWLASDAGGGFREKYGQRIDDYCYLVIGSDPENTVVFGSRDGKFEFAAKGKTPTVLADHARTAHDTAITAIKRIRDGFFWPPGPGNDLRYDLKDIFLNSPANDLVGTTWLAEQEMKLETLASEKAGMANGDGSEEDMP